MLEIKTKAVNMADVLPQLYFSGSPSLALGYHRWVDLNVWERDNAAMLRKLQPAEPFLEMIVLPGELREILLKLCG